MGKANLKKTPQSGPRKPRGTRSATANPTDRVYAVCGAALSREGTPLSGLRVEAFDADLSGVNALGATTTDVQGRYDITYVESAFHKTSQEKGGPELFIRVLEPNGRLLFESPPVANAGPEQRIDAVIATADENAPAGRYVVKGRVSSPDLPSFEGLTAATLEFSVGGAKELCQVPIASDGSYSATSDLGTGKAGDLPDLYVAVREGKKSLGQSAIIIDAMPGTLTIDIALPPGLTTSQSEFDTIRAKLVAIYGGQLDQVDDAAFVEKLGYVAAKVGWDARMLAMARLALRYGHASGDKPSLSAELYYSMFRAGVPGTEGAPFRVSPAAALAIWEKAGNTGVISPLSKKQLAKAKAIFTELASDASLALRPVPGTSTLEEQLTVSFGNDTEAKRTLAHLVAAHGDNASTLWKEVGRAFGEVQRDRLKVDAALADLALGSATVIRNLRQVLPDPSKDLDELALRGFAQAEPWLSFVSDDEIPTAIEGDGPSQRRQRYAELLAAQVRLAYPVAALAHDVREGRVPTDQKSKEAVAAFLAEHRVDYRLGEEPLEHYLTAKEVTISNDVRNELKKMERVYQLTPTDEAMSALLQAGIHSAYQVVQFAPTEFVKTFAVQLGGESVAQMVMAKAQEVHATVINLAIAYHAEKSLLQIGPAHAPIMNQAPVHRALLQANASAAATLETLFGELDYCACEHCRSILSPAAYFVNLLQLCDPVDAPPAGKRRPMDELRLRRPDLEELPLTCENTNTPLPHIDLVNETLEYFVDSVGKPTLTLAGYRGFNTDPSVPAQDLLTEPQNVRASAYANLASAKFPLALPFNEPLESLRHYLKPFGLTLARAMEALRVDENLDAVNPTPYAWRDILIEEMELSRGEYALLTDRTLTIRELYGFPAGVPAVPANLRQAQYFTRRVGISYEELANILQTRFVNPNAWVIPLASKLGVTLAQIKAFAATPVSSASNAAFEAQLSAGLDAAQFGGSIVTWVRDNASTILGLLTLYNTAADPDPCDFSQMQFRYADPTANNGEAREIEFIRLLRFIRIWRKLRWPAASPEELPRHWSIAEVDATLAALYPVTQLPLDANEATNLQRLDEGCKILLLRLGALLRLMHSLGVPDATELGSLLACVAPMQGTGQRTLYRTLFLSAGFLREYPAFTLDSGARPVASNASLVANHASALQAACQLSASEFERIVQELGPQGTALPAAATLATQPSAGDLQVMLGRGPAPAETQYLLRYFRTETMSRVYRRAWLARKLRLSVEELLLISRYSGLSFEGEIGAVSSSDPPNQFEALVRLVSAVRAAGLTPAEALLLFWNHDLLSAGRPARDAALAFATTARAELASVERSMVPTDDPDSALLTQLLSSVFSADTAGRYLDFVERRARSEVTYAHNAATLSAQVLLVGDGLAYDDLFKRLQYTKGVMPPTVLAALLNPALNLPQAFSDAVTALSAKSEEFFLQLNQPALRVAHDTYFTSNAAAEVRRRQLLSDVIDALKPLRRRQVLVARSASMLEAHTEWLTPLLSTPSLLCSAQAVNQDAMHDFLAVGGEGVVGEYFFANLIGAVADAHDANAGRIDYASATARTLPANGLNPGQSIAGRWTGYVEIPASGIFNLEIELEAGAPQPVLTLGGAAITLQAVGGGRPAWRNASALQYQPGTLVAFVLTVTGVKTRVRLLWQTGNIARSSVPGAALYDLTIVNNLVDTYVRALRAGVLRQKLELSDEEALALFSRPSLGITIAAVVRPLLGALPVSSALTVTVQVALGKALSALVGYCRIRHELGATSEAMLPLLVDPSAAVADANGSFARLSGWSTSTVDAILSRMKVLNVGNQPDRAALRNLTTAQRVHDAIRVVKALGVSHTTAFASIANAPAQTAVSDMYAALRARYSALDWSTLIKPINDTLRMRRRDALAAFALVGLSNDTDPSRAAIDTPDRLYEYLLLDVLMHPRVETSRIRQATAAVQQFIQRLVDLPGAEPSDIHIPLAMREQWPWMKRYRVWEANRKVFLYPENWLEPELRDDQSPIFRETMSELLQGDITEERAAEAMIGYLRKLEEISILEPCGIHVDTRETTGDTTDDVMHVVARSSGANRQYFYRRREPSGWTPWEPIKLDVEDNPVLPVRWKGRLFLFWLKVIQEAGAVAKPNWTTGSLANQTAATTTPADPTHRVNAVLCWSEYARGKWGPTRTSSVGRAITLGTEFTAPAGLNPFRREQYRLRAEMSQSSLDILIEPSPGGGLEFLRAPTGYRLYNSFAEPDVLGQFVGTKLLLLSRPQRNVWAEDDQPSSALRVAYRPLSQTSLWSPPEVHALFRRVDGFSGSAVSPAFAVTEFWNRTAPFFYKDAKYAFFITPLSLLPVHLGPWKWSAAPSGKYHFKDRSLEEDEGSPFLMKGSRMFLNDENDFAFGDFHIDSHGTNVNT
jgi:hypothetical protein